MRDVLAVGLLVATSFDVSILVRRESMNVAGYRLSSFEYSLRRTREITLERVSITPPSNREAIMDTIERKKKLLLRRCLTDDSE